MKRRTLMLLLGGAAAAWPLAVRAQQPAMPVIGFLSLSRDAYRLGAFRQGLKDAGFIEGENVVIEYRWADDQIDRLPALATELVRRQVAVIAAIGGVSPAFAAKAATTTIPIVFLAGEDPVQLGLVASLARPGGNLTGINVFLNELASKRLELLREMVPGVTRIAVLVNPANTTGAASTLKGVETAVGGMGLQIQVLNASTIREIDAAFTTLVTERPNALLVQQGGFFVDRRAQLAQLAAHHSVPVIHVDRLYPEVGGLMSYGASLTDGYRHVGVYTGRILKGAKPADLPVVQASKFELIVNAENARMLGITVPDKLLAAADEVIE